MRSSVPWRIPDRSSAIASLLWLYHRSIGAHLWDVNRSTRLPRVPLLLGPEERPSLLLRPQLLGAVGEHVVEAVVAVRLDQPVVGVGRGAGAVAVAAHDAARGARGERHGALAARVGELFEERLAQGQLRLEP